MIDKILFNKKFNVFIIIGILFILILSLFDDKNSELVFGILALMGWIGWSIEEHEHIKLKEKQNDNN